MKDIFDKILIVVPAYMGQVLELLSGPKAFIEGKDLATVESAMEAYTFLGVTLFLTLIATVSFLPEQNDYLLTFAALSVQGAFHLILMVAALCFAWRIVGGTLSYKVFFIVSCYFSGVSTLIFAFFSLLASGWLKLLDPDNAARVLAGATPADPTSVGYQGFSFIFFVGLIAVYVWIFVVWGAYRKLNNVSRGRSAIALTVFIALSPLLLAVQVIMGGNLKPAQDHHVAVAGELPLKIVESCCNQLESII